MDKTDLKSIWLIAIILVTGFIAGRFTVSKETEIKYVKGETITNVVEFPMPYKVEVPSNPIYIRDTITNEIDTLAIIEDWITKRDYKQTLFDNDNGKLDIDFSVQYNKPLDLRYSFTPVYRQLPPKDEVWQPFMSASYSTLNIIGVGCGLFYHDLGLEYQFQRDLRFNDNGHLFSLKYKF